MKKLFEIFSSIGVHPNDKPDTVFQKRMAEEFVPLDEKGFILTGADLP